MRPFRETLQLETADKTILSARTGLTHARQCGVKAAAPCTSLRVQTYVRATDYPIRPNHQPAIYAHRQIDPVSQNRVGETISPALFPYSYHRCEKRENLHKVISAHSQDEYVLRDGSPVVKSALPQPSPNGNLNCGATEPSDAHSATVLAALSRHPLTHHRNG